MRSKLTEKQEEACREYVKNGRNKTKAYIHAYGMSNYKYKTIKEKASRLFSMDKIKERVDELMKPSMEKAQKEINITLEEIIRRFDVLSRSSGKESDQIKATENLAKIIGAYEKDNNQKSKNRFDDMTDEELIQLLKDMKNK